MLVKNLGFSFQKDVFYIAWFYRKEVKAIVSTFFSLQTLYFCTYPSAMLTELQEGTLRDHRLL